MVGHNAQKISKSRVLGPLSFSMWVPAYNSHPGLPCLDQAYSTINNLLISSSGKTRSLSVPFNHPPPKNSKLYLQGLSSWAVQVALVLHVAWPVCLLGRVGVHHLII